MRNPKAFNSWPVVVACFAMTFSLGATFWSFGVFFKPLENEFGWSRMTISASSTAFLIGYAISVVAAGRLADRYSPRFTVLAAALAAGLGISLCSQTHSIGQLSTFLFIAGLGAGATWSIPTSIVQRWFHKRPKAGLALSIVASGGGAGAVLFAPLTNYLILEYGWRNAYLVLGILTFAMIASASIITGRRPIDEQAAAEPKQNALRLTNIQGWPAIKAVTTAPFVAITFAASVAVMAAQVISVHLIPYATDVGITPASSALALGLMGAFSVPGRIIPGLVSDRIGWHKILVLSLFGTLLSMIWLLFLKTEIMLYLFVFFYGICHGGRNVAWMGILGEFFGMRSLGELIGISDAIAEVMAAFGPYIAGFMFDRTGSYFMSFLLIMVLLLAAGLVAISIRKPQIALR